MPLKMVTYSDPSFANCDDMGTKLLCFIILLTDDTGKANWLTYSSFKCRRVDRSVLAGETYTFADCFDAAYAIKHDLQVIMNHNIPLTTLTYSESFFKIIVKSTVTAEMRLMIGIKEAREVYNGDKIANIGWTRTKGNIADGLTKLRRCEYLEELLDNEKIVIGAEQRIVIQRSTLFEGDKQMRSRFRQQRMGSLNQIHKITTQGWHTALLNNVTL